MSATLRGISREALRLRKQAAPPFHPKSAPPEAMLDIGQAIIPRGSTVFIKSAPKPGGGGVDRAFSGTLVSVDMKDGVPFTCGVWNGQKVRQVYVERIQRWVEWTDPNLDTEARRRTAADVMMDGQVFPAGMPGGARVPSDPLEWLRDLFIANGGRISGKAMENAIGRMTFTYGQKILDAWADTVADRSALMVVRDGDDWVNPAVLGSKRKHAERDRISKADNGRPRIDIINDVVNGGIYADDGDLHHIEGAILDGMTASGLKQLYDALSPENQAKFDSIPIMKLVDFMWSKVKIGSVPRKQAEVGTMGIERAVWQADWDKVTEQIEKANAVVTEADGFQWVNEQKLNPEVVRVYRDLASIGYANGFMASKRTAAGDSASMLCLECGKRFKKKIGPSTYEAKCPKCGSYDTDLDYSGGSDANLLPFDQRSTTTATVEVVANNAYQWGWEQAGAGVPLQQALGSVSQHERGLVREAYSDRRFLGANANPFASEANPFMPGNEPEETYGTDTVPAAETNPPAADSKRRPMTTRPRGGGAQDTSVTQGFMP